jgi:hypothetical protein
MTPVATHELTLETFESVAPGGVRRVTWLIEGEDDWMLLAELPAAQVQNLDCGPGVVWRRQVVVTLPVGARLMRVDSIPKRAPAQDPLAYLLAPSARVGRETRRSQFVVAAGGVLQRLPPPPRSSGPKPRAR